MSKSLVIYLYEIFNLIELLLLNIANKKINSCDNKFEFKSCTHSLYYIMRLDENSNNNIKCFYDTDQMIVNKIRVNDTLNELSYILHLITTILFIFFYFLLTQKIYYYDVFKSIIYLYLYYYAKILLRVFHYYCIIYFTFFFFFSLINKKLLYDWS